MNNVQSPTFTPGPSLANKADEPHPSPNVHDELKALGCSIHSLGDVAEGLKSRTASIRRQGPPQVDLPSEHYSKTGSPIATELAAMRLYLDTRINELAEILHTLDVD